MSIRIVTDSSACFDERLRSHYQNYLTTVPYRIQVGDQSLLEAVDIKADALLRHFRNGAVNQVTAPTVEDYVQSYQQLLHHYEQIISIHASRSLSDSVNNASLAAQQVSIDRITVIDSRTMGISQGLLIKQAIHAIDDHCPLEQVIQQVRDSIERLFTMYLVKSPRPLYQSGLLDAPHTLLVDMMRIMPVIQIEEGELSIREKVQSRFQAVDHLVEFLAEFDQLSDGAIIQSGLTLTDDARQLQDRLAAQFTGQHFPYLLYSALVAQYIGGEAMGVAVLDQDYI